VRAGCSDKLPVRFGRGGTEVLNHQDPVSYLMRALAIYEQVLGPNHPDTASSLNNLAALYGNQGQYAEAESLLQRALAIYEQVLGPDHPDTASNLNKLAALYRAQGQYAEAEPRASMPRRSRSTGASWPFVSRC
jgi:tetratricopeptide (TPR) repeat protein